MAYACSIAEDVRAVQIATMGEEKERIPTECEAWGQTALAMMHAQIGPVSRSLSPAAN